MGFFFLTGAIFLWAVTIGSLSLFLLLCFVVGLNWLFLVFVSAFVALLCSFYIIRSRALSPDKMDELSKRCLMLLNLFVMVVCVSSCIMVMYNCPRSGGLFLREGVFYPDYGQYFFSMYW
ncbi:hypothetical protein [Candidatus Ichthyocystis sparus]|uniref:hypothetical protein n=1 Tax=Candidatus Ichthyocystis sparus TaxID=1561004 RepID=UPI0011464E9A|nr:hypothetical protein [Candidatus Ichthyocystis sparus]